MSRSTRTHRVHSVAKGQFTKKVLEHLKKSENEEDYLTDKFQLYKNQGVRFSSNANLGVVKRSICGSAE